MRARPFIVCGILATVLRADIVSSNPGCVVSFIRPGSPAEAAGLKPQDVILKAGGQPVQGIEDLQNVVGRADANLALTFRRGDQTESVSAALGSGKEAPRLGVQCAPPPA